MSSNSHQPLLDCKNFVLKGLKTSSIPEAAVDVIVDGNFAGSFQGLEIFEKCKDGQSYPQTIADLVSNMFFRLTYQKPEGGSATFGSSFIGSYSFRNADNAFHLIPKVLRAEVNTEISHRLKISIFAKFDDLAEVTSIRTYATEAKHFETNMILESTFKALKDVELNRGLLGTDSMRLLSISSMYANSTCYDGNLLKWGKTDGTGFELNIYNVKERGSYFFPNNEITAAFELIKEIGSKGKKNKPGSPDSPSIRVKLTNSSIALDEIGLQAFLMPSLNVDDDSLSVWVEWIKAPAVIKKGTEIKTTIECTAFNYSLDNSS